MTLAERLAALVAGDSLDFTETADGYPASDGWAYVIYLAPRNGGTKIILTGVANGDDFDFVVVAATTASWAPGDYIWSSYASKSPERHLVESGSAKIAVNLAAAGSATDSRSDARKIVDAIDDVLAGRDIPDLQEYTIEGRHFRYVPKLELIELRKHYQGIVLKEEDALRAENGLASKRTQYVRFRVQH